MSKLVRERNKRLRNIAERFVDKEVVASSLEMSNDTYVDALAMRDRIVKSLTTVLDNVDQYARRDKAHIPNASGTDSAHQ